MFEAQNIIFDCLLFISLFFEVFLLITYLEVSEQIKLEADYLKKKLTSFLPVTIIVPSYNEENTVAASVDSLLALDYPKDKLSIILVNDGSTDRTQEVLERYRSNPQVVILSKENGGKHTALNLALKSVRSELVGCLDADTFVSPDALLKIVPYFENPSVMAVTPSIKVHEPRTILQLIQKVEYSFGIFIRRMYASMNAIVVIPGAFSIFRAEVFQKLGGYRKAHFTEDMEMGLRMQKHHYRIVNSLSASVYTTAPRRFPELYRQRVRWTYGYLKNTIDYRELFFNKKYGYAGMLVLPLGVLSLVSTVYAAGYLLWMVSTKAWGAITQYAQVGFHLPPALSDWFYFNTSSMTIIGVMAFLLTLALIFISLYLANGKIKISRDLFYYLAIYALIVPVWSVKSLLNVLVGKDTTWR
jgi:cellulose synthase/poly-beta-1,6-N-acetylglucosamine synthase-like glycosyltransferase